MINVSAEVDTTVDERLKVERSSESRPCSMKKGVE